jgi:hypothetical protein
MLGYGAIGTYLLPAEMQNDTTTLKAFGQFLEKLNIL